MSLSLLLTPSAGRLGPLYKIQGASLISSQGSPPGQSGRT